MDCDTHRGWQARGLRADNTIRRFAPSFVRFVRWCLITLAFFPDNTGTGTEESGCGNIRMAPSEEDSSDRGEVVVTRKFLSTLGP